MAVLLLLAVFFLAGFLVFTFRGQLKSIFGYFSNHVNPVVKMYVTIVLAVATVVVLLFAAKFLWDECRFEQLQQQLTGLESKIAGFKCDEPPGNAPDASFSYYFSILSWLLLVASFVYMAVAFRSGDTKKMVVATVLSSACVITQYLTKTKNLSLDPEISFTFNFYGDQNGSHSGSKANAEMETKTENKTCSVCVGPFETGQSSVNADALARIEDSIKGRHISEIMILGGVDKRQPRRDVRKRFGDNLSLAQARADFVRDYIVGNGHVSRDRIVTSVMGSANPNADGESEWAKSRCAFVIIRYTVSETAQISQRNPK